MTDDEPDIPALTPEARAPDDSPTVVGAAGGGPVAETWPEAEPLPGDLADDEDEWVPRTVGGIRFAIPAALLLAVVLIGGGFLGGVELEKSHSGAGSGTAGLSGFASRFRGGGAAGASGASGVSGVSGVSGAGGFTGFGGFGASTAAATGTISVVDGDTLYVLTATGLVKVTLSPTTTVTRDADTGATDLRPGDTVVVQGATGSGGNVTASSIAATQAGVTATRGGGGAAAAAG